MQWLVRAVGRKMDVRYSSESRSCVQVIRGGQLWWCELGGGWFVIKGAVMKDLKSSYKKAAQAKWWFGGGCQHSGEEGGGCKHNGAFAIVRIHPRCSPPEQQQRTGRGSWWCKLPGQRVFV